MFYCCFLGFSYEVREKRGNFVIIYFKFYRFYYYCNYIGNSCFENCYLL